MVNIVTLTTELTKEVKTVLGRAEDDRRDIVKRCRDYLETSRVAVLGLWRIYDQILENAENCDLQNPEEVRQLRKDIGNYANVDSVRPELRDAIKGLHKRCKELQQKAASKFQLPKVRRRRKNTVEELENVIMDLEEQLTKLEEEGLQFLKSGSGVGIIELSNIISLLEKQKSQPSKIDPSSIRRLVEGIREKRFKDELWKTVDRIKDASEDLDIVFKGLL